jgi:hypothetical protein
MTKVEFYETYLQNLRNELIQDIIHFVKSQKANELSLDSPITVEYIDEQTSVHIESVKVDGDVIVGVTSNDDYYSDLTEFHNDVLLSILRELEEGRFEVFEEDGSEEEA